MHVRRVLGTLMSGLLLIAFGTACAGSGGDVEKREQVARQEASRMHAPTRPLSSFTHFELLPATLGPLVQAEGDKVAYAEKLEGMLREQIQPLFDEWEGESEGSDTLQVRPEIINLRIVSGGARFWAGALAGNSMIDMNLVLIDGESGDLVADPRILRSADAMAGGWSIGATDQNLLHYVAHIAKQYLIANY